MQLTYWSVARIVAGGAAFVLQTTAVFGQDTTITPSDTSTPVATPAVPVPPPPPAVSPTTTAQLSDIGCNGEIIARIDIHSNPPFTPDGGPKLIRRVAKLATSLHAVTQTGVIRRYLTFRTGERCTEYSLRESERILRAQPFIADAIVTVVADGDGKVVIDVTTVDEVSLVLDGTLSSKAPMIRAARFGETNLKGAGIYAVGGWQDGGFFRDIFRARLIDYQFLGRPYQLSVQGTRNEIGGSWDTELSHPFLTDLQRFSWRATAGSSDGYLYFRRPDLDSPALRFVRQYSDIGGVRAFGPVRRLFLVGLSFSREKERTASTPVLVRDSAIVPDTSTALIGRYGEHRTTRLNLLLGLREISFMRVTGFDALEGAQDVRKGFQLSTLVGKGIRSDPQDERDLFLSGDIYGGGGSPTSFIAAELMGERRRDSDMHQWDGVLMSGRAAWYRKPNARHTFISDLEWSGGWRQRVPFQLTFADRDGGIRGYQASELGGAQRLVARLEDRMKLGHLRHFAALGGAAFIDAGELWAGDAPFGVNTGPKFSVGIGLIAAVPPRSRRTWRVDLAMPINDKHDAKFEIRFSNHDFTRWFWREPGDVQTSRERSIPNSVYNWP